MAMRKLKEKEPKCKLSQFLKFFASFKMIARNYVIKLYLFKSKASK